MKQCSNKKLKIIFAGTPIFAASALEALLVKNFEVITVLTQPDRPAGRGMYLTASPVKLIAHQYDIPVLQPLSLKSEEFQSQLDHLNSDLMIVAAYGLILPVTVLQSPKFGCINIHASLLPRWRGAAPIQRAIQAGDEETGITIMQMDKGLDTGPMLLKRHCPINSRDTAQSLHDKLKELGARSIVDALDAISEGKLHGEIQDEANATYAHKITKSEANIDWFQSAAQLDRSIRAYNPSPLASSTINGTTVKILQASVSKSKNIIDAGMIQEISHHGIEVACGDGTLNLEILQKPNSKAMPFSQFLQSFPLNVGDRFLFT